MFTSTNTMSFWGVVLKPGKKESVKTTEGDILHLSQACLNAPKGGKNYLQVTEGETTYAIACLEKDKAEHCSFDLFFSTGDCTFSNKGDSEVHLTGYFEPEPSGDMEDDEEEDDDDDSDEPPAKPAANGKVKSPAAKPATPPQKPASPLQKPASPLQKPGSPQQKAAAAAAAASDDDDEDEEEEEDGSLEDEEAEEDDDLDEEEEESLLEGEEEEEEDEDDEEEDESPPPAKRKGGDAGAPPAKKLKDGGSPKMEAAAAPAGGAAGYVKALHEYLKKNGKTPISVLGSKVKRPPDAPKLKASLDSAKDKFLITGESVEAKK